MSLSARPKYRRPGRIDALASGAARLAPWWSAQFDQVRLDTRSLLDGLAGEKDVPYWSEAAAPRRAVPLGDIKPIEHLVPRALVAKYRSARRDLRMLLGSLAGRNPPPLVPRPDSPPGAPQGDAAPQRVADSAHRTVQLARTLRVCEVRRETRDAVSLVLEDPSGRSIDFVPGQFFTLISNIEGRELRRAYSASSFFGDKARVRLGVKRVTGGQVSNHINDRLQAGDLLRVLGPSGQFTVTPEAGLDREFVLLGGGSGITPLLAITWAVLASEPASRLTLVYGNRGVDDIIYRAELDELAARHPGRFTLRHVLSEPPPGWQGSTGLLDADTLQRELDHLAPGAGALYYVCGPEPMMEAARATLIDRGVPGQQVFEEKFSQPHLRAGQVEQSATAQPAAVRLGSQRYSFTIPPGETVLDAGLAAGVPLRFSCTMGGCGACKVKLRQGEVAMEEPNCLDPGEREQGYVLACVSRARSPIDFEVE
jgi:ferredoxin-NADP reductase